MEQLPKSQQDTYDQVNSQSSSAAKRQKTERQPELVREPEQISPIETFVLNSNETSEDAREEDEDDDDEDATSFQDISLLEGLCGLTEKDTEKLKNLGIMTVKGVLTALNRLEISGMNVITLEKLKSACDKILNSDDSGIVQDGFLTARELSETRKTVFKITTGSKNLDQLLGGGIESGSITEIFGESSSGKTQLCHTLCVTTQVPRSNPETEFHYPGGKVLYIDTENTFRPGRLSTIVEKFNLDQNLVLDNILYARALNAAHQFDLLKAVTNRIRDEGGVFKLLIVDSVVSLFRKDYCLINGAVFKRQEQLYRMMSRLKDIAEEFNIAVLITNHATSDCSSGVSNDNLLGVSGVFKPAGGKAIAHGSTTRVGFSRVGKEGGRRVAKIYGSPGLEETKMEFIITCGGIEDYVEPALEDD